jgi:CRP/FNR family cyclic AMP-dependent transcriptional regulator
MFLIELMSRQLVKEISVRGNEIDDTVKSGQLTYLPPAELLQMLNTSQKTGSLILELSKGEAQIQFDNGELLEVRYGNKENEEAFYDILKESSGKFRFMPREESEGAEKEIIGSFMGLLLEGLQRVDEQKKE